MQLITVSEHTTLQEISNLVGSRNVQSVLTVNQLPRVPNVGEALSKKCEDILESAAAVSWQRKEVLLNGLVQDSDIFEIAATSGESGWKIINELGALPNTLSVPESIRVPDSSAILGNHQPVATTTYEKAISQLRKPSHFIDPGVFVSSALSAVLSKFANINQPSPNLFQYFHIPWGKVSLYSSISNTMVDFPVYPEELSDGVKANYTTMPDMLYQYEPWQLYENSGPRSNPYTFKFHRDMWTGDHRDGKANELIRFCEANCFPRYQGSAVNTPTVSLYIGGENHITGVLNDVSVKWDGPIGLDDWYLYCELELNITEVSEIPLNYDSVRSKSLKS